MDDLPTLHRLHAWLRVERWVGPLSVALFWMPVGLLTTALGAYALALAPVVVHGLWRLRRWGWLAALAVLVGGAGAASLALSGPWLAMRAALVLATFFATTWVLSLAVADWLREAEEDARWARQKAAPGPDALAFQA